MNFLLQEHADGYRKIRGRKVKYGDSTVEFYESRLWIPGAKEIFLTEKSYSAVFNSYSTQGEATTFLYALYEKIKLAFPDSKETFGYDEAKSPYYIIGRWKDGVLIKPYLDLYISEQELEEGKKVFSVALEIE